MMLELGISQAQMQFTKILNKPTIIIDKKSHQKKAVILPYDEYEKLKKQVDNISFSNYLGMLDSTFQTDDERYKNIVK
jgi:hypothetical protein